MTEYEIYGEITEEDRMHAIGLGGRIYYPRVLSANKLAAFLAKHLKE